MRQYENATTGPARGRALAGLEGIVAHKLPGIPLFYGSQYCECRTKAFVGWPTKSNPYGSSGQVALTAEVVVLRLRPKK